MGNTSAQIQNETSGNNLSIAGEQSPARLLISVDSTAMTVRLVLNRSNGARHTTSEIMQALKARGIVFGIKTDVIEELTASTMRVCQAVVAEGILPKPGRNAERINVLAQMECGSAEFQKIKKEKDKKKYADGFRVFCNDALMKIIPAMPGEPGRDVFGHAVDAEPVSGSRFPVGENVHVSADGLRLLASVDGYAVICDGKVSVIEIKKEEIELRVSQDQLTATLIISPGDDERVYLDADSVRELLIGSGVCFGIRHGLDKIIPQKVTAPVEIEVAAGMEPIRGMDGRIELIDFRKKCTGEIYLTDDKGNVDFHERLDSGIARRYETVAVIVPPGRGQGGITVLNEPTPGLVGKPAKFVLGKNVELSEDGTEIIAQSDGMPMMIGNTICVDDCLRIDGNVDYATGNIFFGGSVIIFGDVMPGFFVSASGVVEVMGAVDGGSIVGEAGIIVRGAVFGGGKSKLKTQGDVRFKAAVETIIEADGNVEADHFIRNCNVSAGGNVRITHSGKGHIIGGRIMAGGDIDTLELGRGSNNSTVVEIGCSPSLRKKMDECDADVASLEVQLRSMEPNIRTLVMLKKSGKATDEKIKLLSVLHAIALKIHKKLMERKNELEEIEQKIEKIKCGKIIVRGTVFPGVSIKIGTYPLVIHEESKRIVFFKGQEGIDSKNN